MSAVKIQDLNPVEATIILNGKEYTLRKFDLLARSWAYTEFATEEKPDGLSNLSESMKNIESDFMPLLKCGWHLLKRKRDFGEFKTFVGVIEKGDDEADSIMKMGQLLKAFTYTLGVSEIPESELQEDADLKKH